MKLIVPLVLTCLATPLLFACQSDPRPRSGADTRADVAGGGTAGDPSGGADEKGKGSDGAKGEKDEKEDKAEQLRKKEHELDCARRQLKIARLETESEGREAKNALEAAEFKLKEGLAERDHYKTKESVLKTAEEQLGLERAQEQRERQRQELEEIEKMYKEEEFASLTKELVIRRSRMDLVLSEKSLVLAQQKLADLSEHEIPKKSRELAEEVVKAEKALADVKAKLIRHESEGELKLLKAEHAVEDLEREIAKLKAEVAKAKEAEKQAAEKKEAEKSQAEPKKESQP